MDPDEYDFSVDPEEYVIDEAVATVAEMVEEAVAAEPDGYPVSVEVRMSDEDEGGRPVRLKARSKEDVLASPELKEAFYVQTAPFETDGDVTGLEVSVGFSTGPYDSVSDVFTSETGAQEGEREYALGVASTVSDIVRKSIEVEVL